MFGAYHNAVGHAILDPFHFYNLFRHRFDHLVIVHPPLVTYSRPTLLMCSILEQYVEQVEVESPDLAPFAWQNLGELRTNEAGGKLTFLCYNYWALNRMAHDARRDPSHAMSRGRKYLRLPAKMIDPAETLCKKLGLVIKKPSSSCTRANMAIIASAARRFATPTCGTTSRRFANWWNAATPWSASATAR